MRLTIFSEFTREMNAKRFHLLLYSIALKVFSLHPFNIALPRSNAIEFYLFLYSITLKILWTHGQMVILAKPWNFMKKPWNFMKKPETLGKKTWNYEKNLETLWKNLKLYAGKITQNYISKKLKLYENPEHLWKNTSVPIIPVLMVFFWNKGCHYKINSYLNILFNYDRYIKAFIKHWLEHSPRKFLAFQQTLPKFLHKDISR